MNSKEDRPTKERLTLDEVRQIERLGGVPAVYRRINEALEADDRAFVFKVELHQGGEPWTAFDVLVNGKVFVNLTETRRNEFGGGIRIAPHEQLCGQTILREGDRNSPTFFVAADEYAQFCREARQIYAEYCKDGWSFGLIPSTWFSDATLVQFVRDRIMSHPSFEYYMGLHRTLMISTMWSRCDR